MITMSPPAVIDPASPTIDRRTSLLPMTHAPSTHTDATLGFHGGFVRVIPDTVAALGADAAPIWDTLGLRPDQPLADTRVPTPALCRALTQAQAMTLDPLLPLHAAQAVRPLHLGTLGYALLSSPQGGDGLSLYERFQSLLCDAFHARHRVHQQRIEIRHEPVGTPLPRQAAFWWFLFGARLCFARWVSGRHLTPIRLDLPCPRPAEADAFERLVGAPVRYDTPDARELMPADWLDWLNPNSDPALHAMMAARTAQQHAQRPSSDLLRDARRALTVILSRGQSPQLDTVVAALRQDQGGTVVSGRQLQKRLGEQGLSFKELVEEVRRDMALTLLRDTDQAIADIALQCGYTEVSPFHRAVKRWTGLTPAQVRLHAPTGNAQH